MAWSMITDTAEKKKHFLLHDKGFWDISSDALYIQPHNLYAGSHELETLYDWGFTLDVRYHLTDNKSFYVRWLRYKAGHENLSKGVQDFQNEGPTSIAYGYISRFDIIYAELSQKMPLRSNLTLTLHGGVTYSTQQFKENSHAVSNINQFSETTASNFNFSGTGAVIGLDFDFTIWRNLNIFFYNNIAMQTKNATSLTKSIIVDNNSSTVSQVDDREYGAIASAEGFLGLDYKKNILDGHLHLQVGWVTIQYDAPNLQWGGAFFGARWIGN